MIESQTTRLLIDCGPDIRMSLLRVPFRKLDGVLLTHIHYDHVAGIDDLRAFCVFGDINIYAEDNVGIPCPIVSRPKARSCIQARQS